LVEVNCESDFVARGEQYKAYVDEVAQYIANNNVATVEDVKNGMLVQTNEAVAKIGEKIDIRRFEKVVSTNKIDSYIHMGGKIGVLVEMSANASDELTHDVALQIAASNPLYVKSEDVPNEDVEKEKEILRVQAQAEEKPKPAAIVEKMIDGRIAKFYKEICLIEQPFVKDGDKSVKAILKEGGNVEVFKFSRFTMGEGLEKKSEDLSKEVEEQIANMKK
ncbi:MAG: translation elongation factor Ts, partial [Clostridia bacterium]